MKTFDAAGIARPWLWPSELVGSGGESDSYSQAEIDALLAGYAPWEHNLHVPGAPTNLYVSSSDADLYIDWAVPVVGSPADTYTVTATPTGANPVLSATGITATEKTFVTAAYDIYTVTVTATNAAGTGLGVTLEGYEHEAVVLHPLIAYGNLLALWDAHRIVQGDDSDVISWPSVADTGSPMLLLSSFGNPPKYKATGLNGHPAVRFDGVNDGLEDSTYGVITLQTDGNMTVFVVSLPEASVSQVNGMLNNLGNSYSDGDWWWGISSTGATMFDFRTAGTSPTIRYSETKTPYAAAGVHAIRVAGDTITGAWGNGAKYTSGVAGGSYAASSDQNRFRVGGNIQAGSAFYKGYIGAIAVYLDAKSDADVSSIIAALKTIFGL